MTAAHQIINPPSMAPAQGFAHAVVAAPGRTIYIGGQAAHDGAGELIVGGVIAQFDAACGNVVEALAAAGGRPEHLVSIQIFVTDAGSYRGSLKELGEIYNKHFGHHYPAVALFEVSGLFDPKAQVELMCIAVVPD